MKYTEMQQDLPFCSADVNSGKPLPEKKPAFLTLAASKVVYVPRKNIQEEKLKKK